MATSQLIPPTPNLQDTMRPQPPALPGKRKFPSDDITPTSSKKKRTGPGRLEGRFQTHPQTTTSSPSSSSATPNATNASPFAQIYNPILEKIVPKYEVKAMSVIPSTSISKHVDKALQHLGRFSAWDHTVLPGVVLLCAKSATSNKLITIAELVRRRIGESEQKWYQYNILSETVVFDDPRMQRPAADDDFPSIVEESYMEVDDEGDRQGNKENVADGAAADEAYFETMRPIIHEQAVDPAKPRYKAHMTVLLSRVPLEELRVLTNVGTQSNEQHIDDMRHRKNGMAR
ncbi:hypothetical protein QBC40DRAFT_288262 [Triangularia verruculosa]|uniref:DNA/RNA-binding protein Alba-like domain-containing protein n=1 Tax=Triangularia verruculosa TaxID=2587418 RepID=A0AAN6XDS4_9PEZI|nr:hypothetical protein QBC40DRAFT_288262 [Triangularia verruculosa]